MADEMDLVQQRVADDLQHHITRALAKPITTTREHCAACHAPIPPARCRAIPGVQCCVTCQEITELRNKHYQAATE